MLAGYGNRLIDSGDMDTSAAQKEVSFIEEIKKANMAWLSGTNALKHDKRAEQLSVPLAVDPDTLEVEYG